MLWNAAPTNLTELWTAVANIWQVIPVESFQKCVESISHRVAAFIKARGDPTRYSVGIPNSVTLQYNTIQKDLSHLYTTFPPSSIPSVHNAIFQISN
ncbi:hypothetical protein TNCV_2937631 [Trichonephila clavipes]|nr:hypothetical protein TNCV_2937631 [Trichonephila clavipes]